MAAYEDEGNKNKMSKENGKKPNDAKLKIIMPEEIYDPIYLANRDKYVALGHDTLEERGKKHYRLRLPTPLEENPDFFTVSAMPKVSILRGKAINQDKSFIGGLMSGDEAQKKVGFFKGDALILEKAIMQKIGNLGLGEELNTYGLPSSVENWQNSEVEADLMRNIKT